MHSHRSLLVILLALGALTTCGCGIAEATKKAAERQKEMNDLKVVGLAYHNFHDQNSQGPANWDDLIKVSGDSATIGRVRDAGYQVTWGAKFTDLLQHRDGRKARRRLQDHDGRQRPTSRAINRLLVYHSPV